MAYLTQLDAFGHYRKNPLPGTIFGGRFPIHIWPRPLMWAFEWHEPQKDIILKRGEPLFYCQFEAEGPDRPVQMVEAERTPELAELHEIFAAGLTAYRAQDWQTSTLRFAECLARKADDGPSRIFQYRVQILRATPPPPDWDCVWRHTEK